MLKLGILGGGQLGKMLIQSAVDWNIRLKILDPDTEAPCSVLTDGFEVGSFTDFDTVYRFGKEVDVLTIEIENVNVDALQKLAEEGVKIYPQPHLIRLIQDKRLQKQFYAQHDIPTADFVLTDHQDDLRQWIAFLPAVHKLGRAGYDGKGVQKLHSEADIVKGFDAPSVLEKMVDFEKEISVIVARNAKGEVSSFPIVELVFNPVYNLVEYLFAPAQVSEAVAKRAEEIAVKVIEKLDLVGILAVEMFLTKTGEVLVNEVAPRPHNSGHHTIEANYTSQYQQHLRAILGLPLGSTVARTPSAMVNLLGEGGHTGKAHYQGLAEVLQEQGVYVHLYGKSMTKPFRKMGHVTIIDEDWKEVHRKVKKVQDTLKVISQPAS